ncbi:TIGR02452 family protein [Acidobacteria bacterium ACD]|nr:MAG: TIGR02452 family protein [Acidobacteriota bacterium]MCE7956512.1 TIGR02452 family protein [Acidobacteria bacterium ACB2]MDL1951121.1 TIGR02452 family protein [Acidobacteria bacterium ACD]
MTHCSYASVAQEQLSICKEGGYRRGGSFVPLREAIDRAVAGTRLLREADLDRMLATVPAVPPTGATSVRCLAERSGACVARLLSEGARRVAVLNYANGVEPGGGFLRGAPAQEEALCRCSALYACLTSGRDDARAYYAENLASRSALCLGAILVSPDVPFFRDEELELLDRPFLATVLTAVAPDMGWLDANVAQGFEPATRVREIPGVFARRTRYVLTAARHAGCDALVAGRWGCGAFGNDPEVVAEAFAAAVAEQGGAFERIVFSTRGAAENREPFESRFGPSAPPPA